MTRPARYAAQSRNSSQSGWGREKGGGTGPFEGTVCGVSERFERATSSLWKYRRWPDRVKSRLENIRIARVAVRRDYPTHVKLRTHSPAGERQFSHRPASAISLPCDNAIA